MSAARLRLLHVPQADCGRGKVIKCSVSTCNSGRVKLVFCSASCWDSHLPGARHRSAYFTEETARRE